MKFFYFPLIALFLFSNEVFSQSIPNASFENWYNVGGWYDDPVDWYSNNTSIMSPTVYRDSVAYSGFLSVQVANVVSIPGFVRTIFPFPHYPSSISAEVRSNIVSGDTCTIKVKMYLAGAVVDSAVWINTNSLSSWAHITVPISPLFLSIDTMEISIESGLQIGTWISVDDFSLDTLTANSNTIQKNNIQIFPNPLVDRSFLQIDMDFNLPYDIIITDISGKLVRKLSSFHSTGIEIKREDLVPGCYIVSAFANGIPVANQKLIVN